MADLEDSSSTPSRGGCWNIVKTILHCATVTILFFVIMFGYIYFYRMFGYIHFYPSNDSNDDQWTYAVVSLVIQLVAYPVVGCLYIWNSSGQKEKIISAGFLALVLLVFLVCSIDLPSYPLRVDYLAGANIAAISAYCVWILYPAVQAWLCTVGKIVRSILHGAIVAILFSVITFDYFYLLFHYYFDSPCVLRPAELLVIQLEAYTAVGCLYICNCSSRKEKIISSGFLVLDLLVFLLFSIPYKYYRVGLLFGANILAIFSYCVWKLYPLLLHVLRRALSAPDRDAAVALQEPGLQLPQTPFRIQDLPREFSIDEIRAMTQDFGSKVGQGGFAQVFRGSLDDGTAVAVKQIEITGGEHPVAGEADFLREVSIVANVHHRSLVRLLGYSLPRGGDRYLVYPFFENGSLDSWLFHDGEEKRRLLTWPKRRCIAVDVARALAYLHHECHRRILHLDMKPGNILLDGDLRAQVSDFGISVSIAPDLTSIDTRGRGTIGYMAPEMLVNVVSDKCDVFSYGKMLLELVGGRRNFDPMSTNAASATPDLARDYFPWIVREKMARGELMQAVDAAMGPVDKEAVEVVVKVALCCIQQRRDKRPSMLTVVDMLEGRVDADLPPESRPPSAVNFSEPLSSPHSRGR